METGFVRRDDDEPVDAHAGESVQTELERLRWLIVQTMNGLSEEVLEQIQTTRRMAEQTETVLVELACTQTEQSTANAAERHLRQVSLQIEEAMRNLPADAWDDFARTCVQLARTLARLQPQA
jgi:hypothetical protein